VVDKTLPQVIGLPGSNLLDYTKKKDVFKIMSTSTVPA